MFYYLVKHFVSEKITIIMKIFLHYFVPIILISIYTSFGNYVNHKFHIVKVYSTHYDEVSLIIDREDIVDIGNNYINIIVGDYELNYLSENQIPFQLLITDAERHYSEYLASLKRSDEVLTIENFTFGSLGDFYTLEEIYSEFDKLILKYKDYFIKYEIIGKSFEGRNIYCYSFGAPLENSKPQILLTALHHAREPASVVAIIYFLQKILDDAKKGEINAKNLLNERTIFVIPVVNPDGYYFNQIKYPNGGGLWRKNRYKINDSTFGVDLNRNYGPYEFWNSPNGGSVSTPQSNLYRGSEPFSELETRAIRDFCNAKNIRLALNYHTYGDVLIAPYSSLSKETSDSVLFRYLSSEMTKYNKSAFGLDIKTIGYAACGTADDWMHYDNSLRNSILAMTPEVGNIIDSFWLINYDSEKRKARILDLAKSFFYSNLIFVWSGSTNIVPIDFILNSDSSDSKLNLTIRNIGLDDLNNECLISIVSSNDNIVLKQNRINISELQSTQEIELVFPFFVHSKFKNGTKVDFYVNIEYSDYFRRDTFNVKLYKPNIIPLYESEKHLNLWESQFWGIEYDRELGKYVLNDSPGGKYKDSLNNYLTLQESISLRNLNSALIEFTLKWHIDYNYDIAVLEIFDEAQNKWIPIETSRMKYGLNLKESLHKVDIPAFTGHFPIWIRQYASLDKFLGRDILIRFGLLSGPSLRYEGIFLENINLQVFPEILSYADNYDNFSYISIYPNPVRKGNKLLVSKMNNNSQENVIKIEVYNYLGQFIQSSIFQNGNSMNIATDKLESGIYLLVINNGLRIYSTKFLVLD